MNLVTGWNTLWSSFTAGTGIGTVLAVAGALIIFIFVVKWLWDKRRGQGGAPFPTMAVILGLILAGPTVTIPAILTLFQAVMDIVINIIKWLGGVV